MSLISSWLSTKAFAIVDISDYRRYTILSSIGTTLVRGIESLKYVREFYTPVCYCGDISMPQNVTMNETNCDWLFDMSVKRPHGRALANESCHGFQTFSRQSDIDIMFSPMLYMF